MPPKEKKPKLTPEEKKELAKKKKEEKKLKAAEKKRQVKRDQLSREITYGELTIRRHEKSWRKMLIDITVPRMRQDIEFAWHNFERCIDAKDFTISLLMDEIRDAEEQYMMNIRNHVANIDKQIERFLDTLTEMHDDNVKQLKELNQRTEKDNTSNKASSQNNEEHLKTMLYGLEMKRKEYEKTLRAEYFSKLDEEASKFNNIIQRMRVTLERKYENYWNKTKEVITHYRSKTKERSKEHDTIKAQDDIAQNLLSSQVNKIKRLYDLIRKLRIKYIDLENTQGQQAKYLQVERDFFLDAFRTLKLKLEKDRKHDLFKRTEVTVGFNDTLDYLEGLEKKGETILKLTQVCRKLETLEEKVLPFPNIPMVQLRSLGYQDRHSEKTAQEYLKIFDEYNLELNLFWAKAAAVDAKRWSLNEERDHLLKENYMLKKRVNLYCKCVVCPTLPPIKTRQPGDKIPQICGCALVRTYEKHNCVKSLMQ